MCMILSFEAMWGCGIATVGTDGLGQTRAVGRQAWVAASGAASGTGAPVLAPGAWLVAAGDPQTDVASASGPTGRRSSRTTGIEYVGARRNRCCVAVGRRASVSTGAIMVLSWLVMLAPLAVTAVDVA